MCLLRRRRRRRRRHRWRRLWRRRRRRQRDDDGDADGEGEEGAEGAEGDGLSANRRRRRRLVDGDRPERPREIRVQTVVALELRYRRAGVGRVPEREQDVSPGGHGPAREVGRGGIEGGASSCPFPARAARRRRRRRRRRRHCRSKPKFNP